MTLIKCQECGKQVSTNAESCPHCGATKSSDKNYWQKKIPVGTEFDKLENGAEPYRCAEWKCDRAGRLCMYYKFNGHRKRIPHAEIDSAVAEFKSSGRFGRASFKTHCPVASSNGGCGFAVIVRILEQFCDAEFVGRGVVMPSDTGPR